MSKQAFAELQEAVLGLMSEATRAMEGLEADAQEWNRCALALVRLEKEAEAEREAIADASFRLKTMPASRRYMEERVFIETAEQLARGYPWVNWNSRLGEKNTEKLQAMAKRLYVEKRHKYSMLARAFDLGAADEKRGCLAGPYYEQLVKWRELFSALLNTVGARYRDTVKEGRERKEDIKRTLEGARARLDSIERGMADMRSVQSSLSEFHGAAAMAQAVEEYRAKRHKELTQSKPPAAPVTAAQVRTMNDDGPAPKKAKPAPLPARPRALTAADEYAAEIEKYLDERGLGNDWAAVPTNKATGVNVIGPSFQYNVKLGDASEAARLSGLKRLDEQLAKRHL